MGTCGRAHSSSERSTRAVGRRVHRATRIAVAYAHDPREALERTLERIAERQASRREIPHYDGTELWESTVHELLGEAYPCTVASEFEGVWSELMVAYHERGLAFGRGAFGGWDDADPALARTVWCVLRHTAPDAVVETGVGRGVTTRVILEAMERNGRGHLWSIDLPPLLESELETETAAVVPAERQDRWTLLRGSSRRRLRDLVTRLGKLDVFVHDSFHSARNLCFEWETVLSHMRPPGMLVADDVHMSAGLATFGTAHPELPTVVCRHDDGRGLFAVARGR